MKRWRSAVWLVMALCLGLCGFVLAESDPLKVVYPRHLSDQDVRQANGLAVINLALAHSGTNAEFILSDAPMSRRRMELELKQGELINVAMLPEAAKYDDVYLKVDFAVDRGLLGQRVHLINDQSRGELAAVSSLEDLKALTGCTGSAWRITARMEAQGFNLLKIEKYEDIFVYLARDSCDYMSRGVMEILPEYDTFHERYPNLSIEPDLLVQLPLRNVLYVAPNAPALRDVLARGLANADASGAFDALFDRLYGERLRALNLDQRRVFTLGDPPGPESAQQ